MLKFKKILDKCRNLRCDDDKEIEDLYEVEEIEDLPEIEEIEDLPEVEEKDSESDCYYDDVEIVKIPAKKLEEGWFWYKYSDGSGHLKSPDGKIYMEYDLQTHEYKITPNSRYEFFPLKYYYADGVEPEDFKPFSYMEDEMINFVLPKEKDDFTL